MGLKVDRIYYSANEEAPNEGFADVVVHLDNGRQYIAAFFTYDHVMERRHQHLLNRQKCEGAYFWRKNMVLVEGCNLDVIREVVQCLIDEGEFLEAFEKI